MPDKLGKIEYRIGTNGENETLGTFAKLFRAVHDVNKGFEQGGWTQVVSALKGGGLMAGFNATAGALERGATRIRQAFGEALMGKATLREALGQAAEDTAQSLPIVGEWVKAGRAIRGAWQDYRALRIQMAGADKLDVFRAMSGDTALEFANSEADRIKQAVDRVNQLQDAAKLAGLSGFGAAETRSQLEYERRKGMIKSTEAVDANSAKLLRGFSDELREREKDSIKSSLGDMLDAVRRAHEGMFAQTMRATALANKDFMGAGLIEIDQQERDALGQIMGTFRKFLEGMRSENPDWGSIFEMQGSVFGQLKSTRSRFTTMRDQFRDAESIRAFRANEDIGFGLNRETIANLLLRGGAGDMLKAGDLGINEQIAGRRRALEDMMRSGDTSLAQRGSAFLDMMRLPQIANFMRDEMRQQSTVGATAGLSLGGAGLSGKFEAAREGTGDNAAQRFDQAVGEFGRDVKDFASKAGAGIARAIANSLPGFLRAKWR